MGLFKYGSVVLPRIRVSVHLHQNGICAFCLGSVQDMCTLFRISVVNVQYAQDRFSICVICLEPEYLCTLIKNNVSEPFSQDQLSICAVCSGSEYMCTPSKVGVSVHFAQDQYSICSLCRGTVQYPCTPPNVSVVHVHFTQDQSSLCAVCPGSMFLPTNKMSLPQHIYLRSVQYMCTAQN